MSNWPSLMKLVLACGLAGLTACTMPPELAVDPTLRPESREEPPQEPVEPSAESRELSRYFLRLQNDLLAQGLLRGDGGGPDTPFSDAILARNFVRIALFDEYITDGDFLRPQATISKLRRWDQPVRMAVEFGASVPEEQRRLDRNSINAFAARLGRTTGHPISVTDQSPNFHVLIVSEDDRPAFAERIRQIVPGIATSNLNTMINLPRDQLCIVVAFSEGGSSSYLKAISIIRSEHPNLLRTSCIHEELSQGLGLANDSPQARPSIFNDDEEFGLLTSHDELLLKMLYDDRFKTGMTAAQAAPIARQIAKELLATTPS